MKLKHLVCVLLMVTALTVTAEARESECEARRQVDTQYEQNAYASCVISGGIGCEASFLAHMALIETEYAACVAWAYLYGG